MVNLCHCQLVLGPGGYTMTHDPLRETTYILVVNRRLHALFEPRDLVKGSDDRKTVHLHDQQVI